MEVEEIEEEVNHVDETANFLAEVEDDSDRSESTRSLVKRNVVIGAAPHVRQGQQQPLEGDKQRNTAVKPFGRKSSIQEASPSSGSTIVVAETFKSQKASAKGGRENLPQSTWGGHENSAQSTRSAREN